MPTAATVSRSSDAAGGEPMVTPAKIAANRRNARRSTGPRTAEGKAIASANAVTHGLRSRRVLLPGESAADFDQFCAALREDLAPDGALEATLVDRIVLLVWRLRRIPWVEAGLLRAHACDHRRQQLLNLLLSWPPPVPEAARPVLDAARRRAQCPDNDLGRAFERTAMRSDGMTTLARYETTIDRALHRALAQFDALRSRRGPSTPTVSVMVAQGPATSARVGQPPSLTPSE